MTAQSGVAAAPSAGTVLSLALSLSPQERRSAQKVAAGAAKRAESRRRSGEARRKSPQERRSAQTVAAGAAKRAESRRRSGEARVYCRGELASLSSWLYYTRRRVQKALILSDCHFSL